MRALRDSWLIFRRSLRLTLRQPAWVIMGLIQPVLYLLYFLVGVVAFGLELCWLRLLVFYPQASAHSFAISPSP